MAFDLAPVLEATKEVVRVTGTVPALPGDLLLYLVRVNNHGTGPALQVRLLDPLVDLVLPVPVSLPPGASFLLDTSVTPAVLAVELPRVEAGEAALVAFLVRVAPLPTAAEVCNRVVVTARELATPVPSDDPATVAGNDGRILEDTGG